MFGGQKVYKNFFNQEKQCEKFHAEDLSKLFGLSREKSILLAMLTGMKYIYLNIANINLSSFNITQGVITLTESRTSVQSQL